MFLGIFIITLAFFSYLGIQRVADYMLLSRIVLWMGGQAPKPSISYLGKTLSYLGIMLRSSFKDVFRLLSLPFLFLILYPIAGIMSLFSSEGITKISEETMEKLFLDLCKTLEEAGVLKEEISPSTARNLRSFWFFYIEFLAKHDFNQKVWTDILSNADKNRIRIEQLKDEHLAQEKQ